MATWKEKVCITAAAAGLVVGGLKYLEPTTPQQLREDRLQEQVEQLSDAHEKTTERMRRDGEDIAEADGRDRLRPGEHRPPEPPRVRVRLR